MKYRAYRDYIITFICLLYIILFVYAALAKVLDFENFQIQLGQSPLLSAFPEFISWAVPSAEIVIALLLAIPRYKLWGFYCGYFLMVIFTAYIFIILNFSSRVPCSCGGILEKMGWTEHLIFNIAYTLLGLTAIFIYPSNTKTVS